MAQQSQKFDLPSGASMTVTVAPFADAWALMKASLKTMKGADLKTEDLQRDMTEIMRTPSAFGMVLNRLIEFATSPEVEAATWKCAQRALYVPAGSPQEYPGMKIDPGLFDDPTHGNAAREDYSKIVTGILEVNCLPFLAKALSGLRKQEVVNSGSQPSRSA